MAWDVVHVLQLGHKNRPKQHVDATILVPNNAKKALIHDKAYNWLHSLRLAVELLRSFHRVENEDVGQAQCFQNKELRTYVSKMLVMAF